MPRPVKPLIEVQAYVPVPAGPVIDLQACVPRPVIELQAFVPRPAGTVIELQGFLLRPVRRIKFLEVNNSTNGRSCKTLNITQLGRFVRIWKLTYDFILRYFRYLCILSVSLL